DAFSVFFKVLLGLALLAVVWMSMSSREIQGRPNEGEYYALLLSSGLAMFLMAAAATLLMAYLSLEFVSLTSYVLTGFLRHNRRSGEAALKYLIYGGVASGAMIFGMSWVFGLTGAMDYAGIARGVAALAPGRRGRDAAAPARERPLRRHHDAREPGRALADQHEAAARLLLDRARRLRAARLRRVRRPGRRGAPLLPRRLLRDEPGRLLGRHA